eukprot:gene133-143_t
MSDSEDVIKPTALPEVPVAREVIPWPMWRSALLITSQSFLYGYCFSALNTCLVTGDHSGSDCYDGTESCPPGTVYKDINLSTIEASVATALTVLGAWIGTLVASKPSELKGRKFTLVANTSLFVIGAVLSAIGNIYALMIGRFVSGLGVGISTTVAPVLLTELASPATRGTITTMHQLLITFGILIVNVIGYGFVTYVSHGWQYVQSFSAIPALMLFVLQAYIPESPKWLLAQSVGGLVNGKAVKSARTESQVSDPNPSNGGNDYSAVQLEIGAPKEVENVDEHYKRAKEIIQSLRPAGYDVEQELASTLADAQRDATNEDEVTWAEVFQNRRAVIIGCGLTFFQAITGINSVVFYSSTIFQLAGFSQSIIGSVMFGFINCFMTLVSTAIVDHSGRRILLLRGSYVMLGALIVLAAVLLSSAPSDAQGGVAVAAVLVYVIGFAVGLGAVVWVILSEIMPTRLRMKAVTLFLSANWAANLAISLLTLTAINGLGGVHSGMDDDAEGDAQKKGVAILYIIFAAFTVADIVFVHMLVPETKGKTPQDF